MKRNIIILAAAVASALLSGCCNKERTIEFPSVDAPNTRSLIVEKVELTDSVTNVYIRSYNSPGNWIMLNPEIYLLADGKKYDVIGSEGIDLDQKLNMPADGDSLFTLKFAPLPIRTRSFDFIEGDESGSWNLIGINLSDKKADAYDKGLPEHIRTTPETVTQTPGFVYEVGECTINVHLLGYKPSFGKGPQIHTGNIIAVPQTHQPEIDPLTCSGSISFKHYGTLSGYVRIDNHKIGWFWMAPGETIDLYIDLSYTDYIAAATRKTGKKAVPVKPLYTEGSIYDCINNLPLDLELDKIEMTSDKPNPKIYSLSADEMTEYVINEYKETVRKVEAMESHPLAKNIKLAELKMRCMDGVNNADNSRYFGYMIANRHIKSHEIDFTPDHITEKHRERVYGMFRFDDPMLMMNLGYTGFARMKLDMTDAEKYGNLRYIQPLRQLYILAERGMMNNEQLEEIRGWDNPFFYNMMKDIHENILLKHATESNRIQKTPDVPLEELFKTIVAPHKGKVVIVDLWNTWCEPCREAIKEIEPLKSGKLADEDLVWIYIANETSPISQYLEMIPDIKGLHYKLKNTQWEQIGKDFGINSIPSYILVKKDGTYGVREDFHDHEKLLNTLKEELK